VEKREEKGKTEEKKKAERRNPSGKTRASGPAWQKERTSWLKRDDKKDVGWPEGVSDPVKKRRLGAPCPWFRSLFLNAWKSALRDQKKEKKKKPRMKKKRAETKKKAT